MASPKSAKVRITRTSARVFSSWSRSCANPSWSDLTMVSWAASSGSAAAARPPMPTRCWVAFSSDFMSRTSTPFCVETTSPPPSSTWMKRLWARRFSVSQSCWGRGRCKSLSTASCAGCLSAPAAGPASGSARGGSAFWSVACTSTFAYSSSTRKVESWPRMSSFSSSFVLVSVQLSVSSSWRFAHTANKPTNASSDATVISARGRPRRRTTATQPVRQECGNGVHTCRRARACLPAQGPGARLTQRNPMWLVELSTVSPCRAAGR